MNAKGDVSIRRDACERRFGAFSWLQKMLKEGGIE